VILLADAAARVAGIWMATLGLYVAVAMALFLRHRPRWIAQEAILSDRAKHEGRYRTDLSLPDRLAALIGMSVLCWVLTGLVVAGIFAALTN